MSLSPFYPPRRDYRARPRSRFEIAQERRAAYLRRLHAPINRDRQHAASMRMLRRHQERLREMQELFDMSLNDMGA